jgi:uncharacterized membrane protein
VTDSVHRDTVRLVAFSDGVFAITITLLVPEIRPPTDDTNLLHELLALLPAPDPGRDSRPRQRTAITSAK